MIEKDYGFGNVKFCIKLWFLCTTRLDKLWYVDPLRSYLVVCGLWIQGFYVSIENSTTFEHMIYGKKRYVVTRIPYLVDPTRPWVRTRAVISTQSRMRLGL